mmetsp:Transcript_34445/g.78550  ORF Transcript_34445/g.78550 Transcript_34445/m.78550 type:complete len:802 (-) Transcript_34445:44-2449(-)
MGAADFRAHLSALLAEYERVQAINRQLSAESRIASTGLATASMTFHKHLAGAIEESSPLKARQVWQATLAPMSLRTMSGSSLEGQHIRHSEDTVASGGSGAFDMVEHERLNESVPAERDNVTHLNAESPVHALAEVGFSTAAVLEIPDLGDSFDSPLQSPDTRRSRRRDPTQSRLGCSSITASKRGFSNTMSRRLERCLVLWDGWQIPPDGLPEVPSPRAARRQPTAATGTLAQLALGLRSGDALRSSSILQCLVIRPSSPLKILWDLLSICFLAYDVIYIPLMVFNITESILTKSMVWITLFFWSIDLIFQFFTGYNSGGLVEMRPHKVITNYLRTWFIMDVIIVGTDWFAFSFESDDADSFGVLRVGKSLRMTRMFRVLRMLRIVKVSKILEDLGEWSVPEAASLLLTITKFVLSIVLVSHFLACAWYGIGVSGLAEPHNWVKHFEDEWGENASFLWRYTTAAHWALTQFTPASMEVVPRNTAERMMAIVVPLFAIGTISSFFSNISNSLMQLRKMREEVSRQQDLARRYMSAKRVSLDLGNRVFGCLRESGFSAAQRQQVHISDVEAFQMLPDNIRLELHSEVFLPVLLPHSFFHCLNDMDRDVMRRICQSAISEQTLAAKRQLFTMGDQARYTYFVVSGSVDYEKGWGNEKTIGSVGCCIAELSLWVQWEHQGTLSASTTCELALVSAEDFRSLANRSQGSLLCRFYAQACLDTVTDDQGCVTDMPFELDVHQEIVRKALEQYCDVSTTIAGSECSPPERKLSAPNFLFHWGGNTQAHYKSPLQWFRAGVTGSGGMC